MAWMLACALRKLADSATASIRAAAVLIRPAILAQLLAAEVARAEIRHLRAELRFVAALLLAAAFITGLTKLAAAVPVPVPATATAAIVPVLVVIPVSARGFGVLFIQADGAEEAQH